MSYLDGHGLKGNLQAMKSGRYLFACFLTVCWGLLEASGTMAVAQASRARGQGRLALDTTHASAFEVRPVASTIIVVPGPLRSFLRMAGISSQAPPEEVLPLLAYMVNVRGYQDGKPTEFLLLVKRYLQQARELEELSQPESVIRVSRCEEAKPLLAILGYRLRSSCGADTVLQTDDPDRAFLTIDSGFPLADLEQDLRDNKPFVLPFASSQLPVLFTAKDWNTLSSGPHAPELVESLLFHQDLSSLYRALSRLDNETSAALHHSPGLRTLLRYSKVLDFYGEHLAIRAGRVVVPGGPPAEAAWEELAGASPESTGEFVVRLMTKDAGWLAAYFDALSSISPSRQAYFTQPKRLKSFYEALRGPDPHPGAVHGVFRPDPWLVLLATTLPLEAGGSPHIPGDLDAWKQILEHNATTKITKRWAGRAQHWTDP